MKTIKGGNYILYLDENGNVYGGETIDSNSSLITNLEDVTTNTVKAMTQEDAENF